MLFQSWRFWIAALETLAFGFWVVLADPILITNHYFSQKLGFFQQSCKMVWVNLFLLTFSSLLEYFGNT